MKHSKKQSTSDRSIEKKFRNLQNTQDAIQGLTVWAIHHHDQAERIVDIWAKVFAEAKAPLSLTLMYSCNDIVQICKKKNAGVYKDLFKQHLPDVVTQMSQDDNSIIQPVQRIFKIWGERVVYEEDFINELQECLFTDAVQDKMQQEEIDKKLLAEFKPDKVVESLRGFRRLELDADLKHRQIQNLRLDITNSEAIKQLKDRAHGREYTKQFEEHSHRLTEFNQELEKVMQERSALIELLELTEHFYELQYGEALVVGNAYKNFGLRITKQKKQLDDIMKSFPSPIPSPTMDAPSPAGSSTPPDLAVSAMPSQVVDMEMSDDEQGEPLPEVAAVLEDAYSPGSVDSAPSPLGSPLGVSFSPDATTADLDIVKGRHIQPYDPTGGNDFQNSLSIMGNVYNPKVHLDPRQKQNDLAARLQNLVQVQPVGTSDGDGTPTQDEFLDTSRKRPADDYTPVVPLKKDPMMSAVTEEPDEWDFAWEILESSMINKTAAAISTSNLTTIQPTDTLPSDLNQKPALLKSQSAPVRHNRGLAMSLGVLNDKMDDSSKSNESENNIVTPVTVPPAQLSLANLGPAISAAVSAALVQKLGQVPNTTAEAPSNSTPMEDENAKAQREFLERITQKGPFKPSRYLQKLQEEKEKKPKVNRSESAPAVTEVVPGDAQFGQYMTPQPAPIRPRVEYRIGGVSRPSTESAPVERPAMVPPPVQDPRLPVPSLATNYAVSPAKPNEPPPGFAPVTVQTTTQPMDSQLHYTDHNAHSAPNYPPPSDFTDFDFPPDFPPPQNDFPPPQTDFPPPQTDFPPQQSGGQALDQDMRIFSRTQPPPPPPRPRYHNNGNTRGPNPGFPGYDNQSAPNTPGTPSTPGGYSPSHPNRGNQARNPGPPPDFPRAFGHFNENTRMEHRAPPPWHGGPPPGPPGPPPASFFRPRFAGFE